MTAERENPRPAKSPGGASARELLKGTGWQAPFPPRIPVRHGRQENGFNLTFTKGEGGERVYALKA